MLAKSALLTLLPFALQAFAAPTSQILTRGNASLNPQCAPGGNFDLHAWNLQLPFGSPGKPTTVTPDQLKSCSGYTNKDYFLTSTTDGTMVMKVPGSPDSTGCVTTTNSKHCRTELRELGSWDPNASSNKLTATLSVAKADDSAHGTVIGQIHIDDSVSSKPVCELFYNTKGEITMGVEQTRDGGNEKVSPVLATKALNTKFTYEIAYESNVLSVTIDGKKTTLETYQLDAPKSYFKAGNYNQGDSPSEVHFYSLSLDH